MSGEARNIRGVSEGELRLTLHDGEILAIAAQDVSRVCENLWRLESEPDAVALAAVLVAESRQLFARVPLTLTAPQSALIRKAVAVPEAA